MKKTLIVLTALLAAFILCCATASAAVPMMDEAVAETPAERPVAGNRTAPRRASLSAAALSGTCGDGLTWSLDAQSGVLTIGGAGAMSDWSTMDYAPWGDHWSKIRSVRIEEGVTKVGAWAFDSCSNLAWVALPQSVKTVGNYAFNQCTAFTDVFQAGAKKPAVGSGNPVLDSACWHLDYNGGDVVSLTGDEAITLPSALAFKGEEIELVVQAPQLGYALDHFSLTNATATDYTLHVDEEGEFEAVTVSAVFSEVRPGQSISRSGTCGEQLYWYLYSDGVLYIGGRGDMEDYSDLSTGNRYPWTSTLSALKSVVLAPGVTSVGEYAFYGYSRLTTVDIPSSLKEIRTGAFYRCSMLRTVNITDMSAWCQMDNMGLNQYLIDGANLYLNGELVTDVVIPDGTSKIAYQAFYHLKNLTSVTIPASVTTIGSRAFDGCTGLTSVTFSEGVTEIGYCAFYDCAGLTTLELPEGLTTIGEMAFSGCTGLTALSLPSSLTTIGYQTFCNCAGLTALELPKRLTAIGGWAFAGFTGLTEVTIPEGVTTIGSYAFRNCTALRTIDIPGSVTSMGDYMLEGCTALQSMRVPAYGGYHIGKLFASRQILSSNQKPTAPAGMVATTVNGSGYYLLPANLRSVTITGDYVSQGQFSDCASLTSIVLPEGVTTINREAFSGCTGLTSIAVPDSLKYVGPRAFYGCTGLTRVDCSSLEVWLDIDFARNTSSYSNYSDPYANPLAYAGDLYLDGQLLTHLEIPQGVKELKNYAFAGCSMTSAVVPDSVSYAAGGVFAGCTALTDLTLPRVTTWSEGIYPLGKWFGSIYDGGQYFKNCKSVTQPYTSGSFTYEDYYYIPLSLERVTITGGRVEKGAFLDCSMLKRVTLGDDVTFVDTSAGAFTGCTGLEEIVVTGEKAGCCTDSRGILYSAGKETLMVYPAGKTERYYTLPSVTTAIQKGAFSGSATLENLYIPATVTDIADGAVVNCPAVTLYVHRRTAAAEYASTSGVNFRYMDGLELTAVTAETKAGHGVITGAEDGGELFLTGDYDGVKLHLNDYTVRYGEPEAGLQEVSVVCAEGEFTLPGVLRYDPERRTLLDFGAVPGEPVENETLWCAIYGEDNQLRSVQKSRLNQGHGVVAVEKSALADMEKAKFFALAPDSFNTRCAALSIEAAP